MPMIRSVVSVLFLLVLTACGGGLHWELKTTGPSSSPSQGDRVSHGARNLFPSQPAEVDVRSRTFMRALDLGQRVREAERSGEVCVFLEQGGRVGDAVFCLLGDLRGREFVLKFELDFGREFAGYPVYRFNLDSALVGRSGGTSITPNLDHRRHDSFERAPSTERLTYREWKKLTNAGAGCKVVAKWEAEGYYLCIPGSIRKQLNNSDRLLFELDSRDYSRQVSRKVLVLARVNGQKVRRLQSSRVGQPGWRPLDSKGPWEEFWDIEELELLYTN